MAFGVLYRGKTRATNARRSGGSHAEYYQTDAEEVVTDDEPIRLKPPELSDIFQKQTETTDKELDQWGKKYIKGFKGVIARSDFDNLYPLNEMMEPGSSCIINLDYGDYKRGGTHWTAVRVSDETPQLLYFDSFGAPPPKDVTIRALADCRGVSYPDIVYQGEDQKNCGQRALSALFFMADEAEKNNEIGAFNQLGQV